MCRCVYFYLIALHYYVFYVENPPFPSLLHTRNQLRGKDSQRISSSWLAICGDHRCSRMPFTLVDCCGVWELLNSNLVKSRLPICYFLVVQSFWNFCTEHGSISALLCAKFRNDWTNKHCGIDEHFLIYDDFRMYFSFCNEPQCMTIL